MEIQGPAGQRQQDGGPGLPAQREEGSEDEDRAVAGTGGGGGNVYPIYMVVNLGASTDSPAAASDSTELPRPSAAPDLGYLTVRLENGVLTLGTREAPESGEIAESRPHPRPGSHSAPATPQQAWASDLSPQGDPSSISTAQHSFSEGLDDVDMVLRDPEDEHVTSFLVGDIGELQVNLGEALDLARKGVLLVFRCPEPGCAKAFDRKQQLKVHLLSHTEDQRPFKCHLDDCGWSFTTLYKLKRHLQSHDKQRPFPCETPGCGKSFTTVYNLKAHLKAHEMENQFRCEACGDSFPTATKLGAHRRAHFEPERPYKCEFHGCDKTFITVTALFSHHRAHVREQELFTCSFPGCNKQYDKACRLKIHLRSHTGCGAKFSARSSLYIHSKKHLQDVDASKSRCSVSNCSKIFTSKQSLKSHMVKQHGQDLEAASSLTPSSELTSSAQSDLSNLDLSSLFTNVSSGGSGISADLTLVNSGILTIDVSSVRSTLGGNLTTNNNSLAHPVDPLVLVSNNESHHSLESSLLLGAAASILQQGNLHLDDVQTVNAEALGSLASLSMRGSNQDLHALTSTNNLTIDSSTLTPSVSLATSSSMPELLTQVKAEGSLLPSSEVVGQQEGSKVVTQFVFPNPTGTYSSQKETEFSPVAGSSVVESGGSARTDYRAIQLAKSKKKGGSSTGSPQKKSKGTKPNSVVSPTGNRFGGSVVVPNSGLTIRDPATGAQYVQIQLLQDDPPGDGDLPFQLNAQSPAAHTPLTVDLPVHILQEPHASTEEEATSDNSQFTGSTINLQDLE
ncbi:zinc finger protein ZXDC isoform X4 [Pseudophryne corroboree]|uniref:zinc finger protein ZXDC isoform X4 n=1 Tax=Pseudophryne corroboree TaxID=495146 RepID=UPI0030817880